MRKYTTKRRTVLTMVIALGIVAMFVVRLVDIQVVRAAAYDAESEGKRSIPTTIFAIRGAITDENGTVLADSVMRYNVTVSPKNAKEFVRATDREDVIITPQQAAVEIGQVTGQKPADILKIIADALAKDPTSDFAYITKGVDVDAFRKLNALNIPWIFFEQAPGRTYPNGGVAGNLLGYVGQDGAAQAGLEYAQNECLSGVNGEETYQRGADGIRIPGSTVSSVTAQNGGTLKLTIDSDLQWYAQQILAKQVSAVGGKWGIAVVQEVKTGKLLAVADYPSLDPNNVSGSDPNYRGSQAFMAPYEPGSTIKPLTASMLLDAGLATPDSHVVAPSSISFPNGAHVRDATAHATFPLTLTGVLQESSNVGITQLGEALAPERRFDYLQKYGFGSATNVNFTAESGGILHPYQEWDNQTYYNVMFGQGMASTAIQVASAYQALGNRGVRLPVQLVESCTKPDGTVVKPDLPAPVKVVSPEAATTTVNMLENFVTQGWITPYVSIPGYRVAMKTGTAEQSDGSGGLSSAFVVSNLGVVPANDPQYVIAVTISSPQSNSSMACPPVFKDLATQVLKRYRIQPSPDSSPVMPIRY